MGTASVTTDSIGFSCGLKYGDIIRTCIIVQDKLPSFKSLPKSDIENYEAEVRHTLKKAFSRCIACSLACTTLWLHARFV